MILSHRLKFASVFGVLAFQFAAAGIFDTDNSLELEAIKIFPKDKAFLVCGGKKKPALVVGQSAYELKFKKMAVSRTHELHVSLETHKFTCQGDAKKGTWVETEFTNDEIFFVLNHHGDKIQAADLINTFPIQKELSFTVPVKVPLISEKVANYYRVGDSIDFELRFGVSRTGPALADVPALYEATASIRITNEVAFDGKLTSTLDPARAYWCGVLPPPDRLLPGKRADGLQPPESDGPPPAGWDWFYGLANLRVEYVINNKKKDAIKISYEAYGVQCVKQTDGTYRWELSPFPADTRLFSGPFIQYVGTDGSEHSEVTDNDIQAYIAMSKNHHQHLNGRNPALFEMIVPLADLVERSEVKKWKAGNPIDVKMSAGLSSAYTPIPPMGIGGRWGWANMGRIYGIYMVNFTLEPSGKTIGGSFQARAFSKQSFGEGRTNSELSEPVKTIRFVASTVSGKFQYSTKTERGGESMILDADECALQVSQKSPRSFMVEVGRKTNRDAGIHGYGVASIFESGIFKDGILELRRQPRNSQEDCLIRAEINGDFQGVRSLDYQCSENGKTVSSVHCENFKPKSLN